MSAYTATLTGETSHTAILYDVNTYSQGKYLRQFDPGDKLADVSKFRVPGTNGNLITRNGTVGHVIHMCVRYISADFDALEAEIASDLNIFSSEAVTILHAGVTYSGCNLIAGSARRCSPVQSTGRVAGDVFVDLVLKFNEDLPS